MTDYAQALKKLKTSALGAATVRAFAALEADAKIRNPDSLAREFLDPGSRPEPGRPQDVVQFRTQLEAILPGAYHFQNSRTMHFDASVQQAVSDGFKQIVLLGAGFDSRAYRLGLDAPDVRVFEVDLPELQAEKYAKIVGLFGSRPAHVAYVPLDFNAQPLENIAASPGYDATRRTFFLWEGVSYYLEPAGIDATLRFVSERSAAGSRIAFDYMPKSMVDGSGAYYGGAESRAYMASFGEPLRFGIEEGGLERFLAERGFGLTRALTHRDLEQTYLIGTSGGLHGRVSGYVRIAEAISHPRR